MSTNRHVSELIPAYTIGCLDEDELIRVSEHLANCQICQEELTVYQAIADQLALAVPDTAPPARLKDRLMTRVKAQQTTAAGSPSKAGWWNLLSLKPSPGLIWNLVSLILIVILAASNLFLWQRINQLGSPFPPDTIQATLIHATERVPGASAIVTMGADGVQGALIVDRLPQLDASQQYQLWLIRDGQYTSGAVFSVDETGYRGMGVDAPESLSAYSAVEVTIEPEGGSTSPTGEVVLRGRLK
jgi:anti-sigma-K factor RskA